MGMPGEALTAFPFSGHRPSPGPSAVLSSLCCVPSVPGAAAQQLLKPNEAEISKQRPPPKLVPSLFCTPKFEKHRFKGMASGTSDI